MSDVTMIKGYAIPSGSRMDYSDYSGFADLGAFNEDALPAPEMFRPIPPLEGYGSYGMLVDHPTMNRQLSDVVPNPGCETGYIDPATGLCAAAPVASASTVDAGLIRPTPVEAVLASAYQSACQSGLIDCSQAQGRTINGQVWYPAYPGGPYLDANGYVYADSSGRPVNQPASAPGTYFGFTGTQILLGLGIGWFLFRR